VPTLDDHRALVEREAAERRAREDPAHAALVERFRLAKHLLPDSTQIGGLAR
jgi:hypothetical protein